MLEERVQFTSVPALNENDVVTIDNLLDSDDLKEAWLFTMLVDVEWLLSHISGKVKIHLFHGMGTLEKRKDMEMHNVEVSSEWGSHHSKLMFLDYGCRLKLAILTANLVDYDWVNRSQGVWNVSVLPGTTTCGFEHDLVAYLRHYGTSTRQLIDRIKRFNWSHVKGKLVASVPGYHSGQMWGLPRIKQLVPNSSEVIAQVSSIGAQDRPFKALLEHSFHTRSLKVVFPTVEEVANSFDGYHSGASLFFKRTQRSLNLLNLCHWEGPRQRASPHIKTYCGWVQGRQRWYLLTSANLSKAAWGTYRRDRLWIQSFECGILLDSGPLPYSYPARNYTENDLPWSPNEEILKPDCLGNYWTDYN